MTSNMGLQLSFSPSVTLRSRAYLAVVFGIGSILCLLIRPALGAGQYLTEEEALNIAFPHADSVEKEITLATNEQREEIARLLDKKKRFVSRFFKYYEGRQEGELQGYAVIDGVVGKHKPITYMLAFSPAHRVKAMEILVYRESYGYEIRQESFRKQFFGKGIEDPLRLNHEIRNISGATISCRSMIRAVREKLAYLQVLLPRKEAPPEADSTTAPRESSWKDDAGDESDVSAPVLRRRSRLLMGTLLEIAVYAPGLKAADQAINAAFAEVERIEGLLSTYRQETVISQLNREGFDTPVALGRETWALLERSRAFTRTTGGWFDITMGPVVQLWQEAERRHQPPSPERIETAQAKTGIGQLRLLPGFQARLAEPGASVDLGAIGKGYALDRAAAVLREQGARRALLNFGGHILAMDPPPGHCGWKVCIRNPVNGLPMACVSVANEAIATSADTERGRVIDGRRYSHIIDPHTGSPAAAALNATVIADQAEFTDAWATALFAMGVDNAIELAEKEDLPVLLMSRQGRLILHDDERFEMIQTPSFSLKREGRP